MKILSNPLVIGAIVLGAGYVALKMGLFDSILGADLAREYREKGLDPSRAMANPNLRPGIREAFY